MVSYIIRDIDLIVKLTNKDYYHMIILHLDKSNKKATYESDYTLFELTEKIDYETALSILTI
jgi:hypothetical protein